MATQPAEPIAPAALDSRRRQLVAEERALLKEVEVFKENLRYLESGRGLITNQLFVDRNAPTLQKLWDGVYDTRTKSALLEPEILKAKAVLTHAKDRLAVVQGELRGASGALADVRRSEIRREPSPAWADPEVQKEFQAMKHLVQTQAGVRATIADLDGQIDFWTKAKVAAEGGRTHIDSETYGRLTFGCFSSAEKVARVDATIRECREKATELRKQHEGIETKLQSSRKALAPKVIKEYRARQAALDALMLQCEELAQSMNALAAASTDVGIALPRAYSDFFGVMEEALSRGTSEFRRQRWELISAGALGAKEAKR